MTMTRTPHPYFGIWFNRFFLRAWLIIVILFFLGMVFLKNDFSVIGAVFAISFGISIPSIISYLFYRLYHVECPSCHGPLKTVKNIEMSKYEAVCDQCRIIWDLGVGIGHSSD